MFDFLEPKREPARVPYRPPEEAQGSVIANLKPGEVKKIIPKAKPPAAKQALTYTGGKGKVGNTIYPTKQEVEMEPMTVTGEGPSPDVTDQELEEIMPPPKKPLEEQIAETVKGKPHVEAKQTRNEMVETNQKETTEEIVSDDSMWDDIWPALIPIATNALLGDGTHDVAFNEAANVIDKVRKEKIAFAKASGKSKAGGLSLEDRMLLAEQKIEGQKELKEMDIGGKKELKGVDLDNKLVQMRSAHGNKIIEQKYRDMGLDNRQIEKYKMTPVDIQDPATGKPKAMSAFEYFSLPLNERPQRVPKNVGSQRPAIMNWEDKNTGKKYQTATDISTGKEIYTKEVSAPDEAIPGLNRQQYNAVAKDTVKQYETVVADQVEKEKDMTFAYEAFLSGNSTAALGALVTTLRSLGEKGTLTEGDYQRMRGEVSIVQDYYRQLLEAGTNKVNPNLLGRITDLAERMIASSQRRIEDAHTEYTNVLTNKTKGKNIPKETWSEFLQGHTPDRSYLASLQEIKKKQAARGMLGKPGKDSIRQERIKELKAKAGEP